MLKAFYKEYCIQIELLTFIYKNNKTNHDIIKRFKGCKQCQIFMDNQMYK